MVQIISQIYQIISMNLKEKHNNLLNINITRKILIKRKENIIIYLHTSVIISMIKMMRNIIITIKIIILK